MKIRKSILLFLTIITIITVTIVSEYSSRKTVFWPGWFILKLPQETAGSKGIEVLAAAGIPGAVGASNSLVGYMDIPEIRYTAISELDEVLSRGDPRRDPYLSSVSSLFRSAESELIYLPADRSLRSYLRVIRNIPELRDGRIMDRQQGSFPFYSVIFLGLTLVLCRTTRRDFSWIGWIAAALPSAVLMMYLDPLKLFPLLLVFVMSPAQQWTSRAEQGKYRTAAGYLGFSFAAIALYRNLEIMRGFELTLALLCTQTVHLMLFRGSDINIGAEISGRSPTEIRRKKDTKSVLRLRRRDHSLFEPVSLMRSRTAVLKRPIYFLKAAAAVLLLLSFAVPYRIESTHSPIPAAKKSNAGFSDISAIHALENRRNGKSLPDLSQLLASAAFQEGFMYGGEFRLPMPDEELTISTFSGSGSRILSSDRPVTVYNAEWFEKTIQRELSQGPGLLFASLGGPSSVSSISAGPLVSDYRFNPLHVVFSGIAFLISLLFIFRPAMRERVGGSFNIPIFITRRRAQAA